MEEKPSILHELYVFCEWKPEPEYIQKPDSILPENISTLWRWLTFFGPKKSLIDSVTAQKERQQKWHMALGDEGKVIAILTDHILEIRTKRSDYATIAARTTVSRDAYSQWRKLVWSPDCAFLAVAYGNGIVSFFDLTASNLFNIPADCSRPGGLECTDNTHAVADIIFMPLRAKDNKWNWEVLIVTFDGKLRGYLVSNTDGFKLHHTFSFTGGVSALAHCRHHDTLIVAGLPRGPCKDPSSPLSAGLTSWRILNDDPFYKLSVVSDELEAQLLNNRLNMYIPFMAGKNLAFIINMVISPDGHHLVCVHCNGDVTTWRLPLLKLVSRVPLSSQPQYDLRPDVDDEETANSKDLMVYCPADVQWWDNQLIIVSRFSGGVSVCGPAALESVLTAPVTLCGPPRVTPAHDGAFLAMECDSRTLPPLRRNDSQGNELVSTSVEEEDTMFELTKELLKSVLFAITDMETFQPRPKKITVVSRTYRLLGIKSTTPDELFNRKIESGLYKEALQLAQRFSLDSDLVYQQQWRKTPVSADAIEKHLSKVSKKIWAVHQCVDRLPETLPAAKELLKFGLQLTNDEILKEINKERAHPLSSVEDVTLEDLNAYTSELLRCRHVMLFNKERLKLYEAILKTEKSTYTKEEYDRLRSNSIVHSAIELAKEGRVAALVCLWPHISSLAMQLTVLENLPETTDPQLYETLLPGIDADGEIVLNITAKTVDKDKDWCRHERFRSIWDSAWSEDLTPESDVQKQLVAAQELSQWYDKRAREIVNYSGLITHSITLLTMATLDRSVTGVELTLFNLYTLYTIVYEIYIDDVTLEQIDSLTPLETCKVLMRKSTPETFLRDIKRYLMPYLKRYDQMHEKTDSCVTGLMDYLESVSVDDLTPVLMLLQSEEFDLDVRTRVRLAERCLYSYAGIEQFNVACDILDAVLKESDGSIAPSELLHRQKRLERIIAAARIVWTRQVDVSLAQLRDYRSDAPAACRTLARVANMLSEEKPNQQEWEKLLKDLLDLHSIVFACVSKEQCYEIYASALLRSGDASSIKLASDALTCSKTDVNKKHLVPYDKSVELIINAAMGYFNSSSSLNDPALELARFCLNLIRDDNPLISDELDLIDAMKILDSFKLNVLPIQVRISPDRMSLIEQCLAENPSAVNATHKLLHLAKLLRISDDELKREGMVCASVCVRARGSGPPAVWAGAALRLAQLRYPPAALTLAETATDPKAPLDRNARRDLLSAAATYCTPDTLEDILKARLSLELEGIQQSGTAPFQQPDHDGDEEFADAMTTPVIEKKDIVPPDSTDKKIPLLSFLLDTVHNKLHWPEERTDQSSEPVEKRIHVPEMYRSLYKEHAVSDAQFSYSQFTAPRREMSPLSLAHTALLLFYGQHTLGEPTPHKERKVVTRCAEELVYTDTPLAVSCLMQGRRSSPLMDTRAAVCALLYAAVLRANGLDLNDNVYYASPVQLTTTVRRRSATDQQMMLIAECLDKLIQTAEVDRLREYGYSVNAAWYDADTDYKKEIIYRLARSPTKQHQDYAWSLANKYEIDTEELWVLHASSIIHDSDAVKKLSMDMGEIFREVEERKHLAEKLNNELWKCVEGANHNALINLFTLLMVADENTPVHGLTPQEHIKLLKKAKASCSDLDYKLLLAQPSRDAFLSHVLDIVTPENVGMLTKFIRALPHQHFKIPVSINAIYTAWLTNYFFSVSQSAASNKKWMQQYRQCASYFNKLSHRDLLEFITNTCFSAEAIERVPVGTRSLMVMQAADYCQQEQESDLNPNKEEWERVGKELTRWSKFLDNFHSTTVQEILKNTNMTNQVLSELEKSRGAVSGVLPGLSAMVMEGLSPAALDTLRHSLTEDLSPELVFQWITDHLLHTPLDVQILISRLTHYNKEGVTFSNELIENVMSKATDHGIPPHKQIGLLALTNNNQIQDGADLHKISQFTVDLLNAEWGGDIGRDINEEMLQSEDGRRRTFRKLIENCDSWQKRKALVDVLNCWPIIPNSGDSNSLQCEYLSYLLKITEQKEALVLIKLLLRRPALVEQEIVWLIENSPGEVIISLMWIILLSKIENSIKLIPKLAIQHKVNLLNPDIEDDLIKELLDSGLFLKLVSTPLYSPVINYLLSQQMQAGDSGGRYNVKWATDELSKANFIAEAGQLHLLSIGVPSPLRGFSESVMYCMNLFKKD